jgi:prolipoprotein diacylglyceryl transferase
MITNTINPIALSFGAVSIRWYGLLFSCGFIMGYIIMQFLFKRKGYKGEDLDKLLFYIFLGTVIGARLAHCLIYEPDYYLSHPIDILKVWQGGLASHGGTVGVFLAIFLFLRNKKYRFFELTDMLCIPVALVCTLIRIGNYCNSEILGKFTHSDYGVVFARLGENMPRHPVQLYESLTYFMIFILLVCIYFYYKKRPEGFILGLLLTLVFTSRMLLEPFKEEQAQYTTGFWNVGSLLSIPFVILGLAVIYYSFHKQNKTGTHHES